MCAEGKISCDIIVLSDVTGGFDLNHIILDLVYPVSLYCICCHRFVDESMPYSLCSTCLSKLRWANSRTCDKCGKILGDHNPMSICYSCREHGHSFDRGYTCAEYGMYEKEIIFNLKYRHKTHIAPIIAEIMHDRMDAVVMEEYPDVIIPVPMHVNKERRRGFNQAALIAKAFARLEGMEYRGDLVLRSKSTRVMKRLSPEERLNNVRSAFELYEGTRRYISGKNICVVDDIYTTGATVDSMARLLKGTGATRVDVMTFAAGADMIKEEAI